MNRSFWRSFVGRFVPDLEAVNLLEYFFIAAVSSLLGIRVYLAATGYPQLGGGNVHIAHMLWGGLFMLAALVLFMSFINSGTKVLGAVLGGVGFGTFIDELGKFVTADNNYFYQPTIAMIYVVFVLLFLLIRIVASITRYSTKTYTANAIEGLREMVIADLDTEERRKALAYLAKGDQADPVVAALTRFLEGTSALPKREHRVMAWIGLPLRWYRAVIGRRMVSKGLVGLFVGMTGFNVVVSGLVLGSTGFEPTLAQLGYVVSVGVAALYVVGGLYMYVRGRRVRAYTYLQRSAYVSIFLIQFFIFLQDQLSGIVWLGFYVTVYLILRSVIGRERYAVQ